jgi:hypothetical protein
MCFGAQRRQPLHYLVIIFDFQEDQAAACAERKTNSSNGVVILHQLLSFLEDRLVVGGIFTFLTDLQ